METVKYIVKRLLLAVLILFGVSVIIYGLARIMPTDFVDNKFSSAVSQGTMTQADIDRIKELYGLNMPDAFLTMKIGKGSIYEGKTFRANAKQDTYESEIKYGKPYIEWYTDSRNTSGIKGGSAAYESGNIRLVLISNNIQQGDKTGTFQIGEVKDLGLVSSEDIKGDSQIEFDVVFTPKETGTFVIKETEGMSNGEIRDITLILNGKEVELDVSYRTATGGEKFAAILEGYFTWLGNMLKGDLGMSFKYNQPVATVIAKNMGISFGIAFVATILQFLIAIPLGIKAATNQYGVIDYTVTVLTMIGISLPTFFLGALVIRVFSDGLQWFPVSGLVSPTLPRDVSAIARFGDMVWHMVLPMFVLVVLSIGSLMRYTRTNTLEALNADYVRTARAKGLSEKTVIYKHAFRNTMIPLVTLMAGILPSLFGGAMITETVFAIPGIGQMAYEALKIGDVPFIMGYNMFISVLTVIGTLLSDLMYAVVDPRVKIGK